MLRLVHLVESELPVETERFDLLVSDVSAPREGLDPPACHAQGCERELDDDDR